MHGGKFLCVDTTETLAASALCRTVIESFHDTLTSLGFLKRANFLHGGRASSLSGADNSQVHRLPRQVTPLTDEANAAAASVVYVHLGHC